MQKLQWSALEYEEKERSTDWFWALGVIIVTGSLTSIIYNNYFFAVLLILSGVLLGFFATKKPDLISYELNARGLKVRTRLYLYENIKSFWVQIENKRHKEDSTEEIKPTLFIKSERVFMPVLSIPIEETMAESIHSIMTSNSVTEEEMREHVSEKIMEFLGF
ncbi:MAG: hypothetical protein AAB786_01255 [Patescibacteria group bacterium]